MQASWTDNPLSYYPKACCRERFLSAFHVCVQSRLICTYPAECVLGFGCQPHSANPVWRLGIFSSCGVGLWYIKEHRGLAPSASLAVRFDSVALSLGDPARTVCSNPPPPSRPPKLGPCGTDAWNSWPHKEAPHMEA